MRQAEMHIPAKRPTVRITCLKEAARNGTLPVNRLLSICWRKLLSGLGNLVMP